MSINPKQQLIQVAAMADLLPDCGVTMDNVLAPIVPLTIERLFRQVGHGPSVTSLSFFTSPREQRS